MRLKLYEDAIRSRKKTDSVKSDAAGTDEATSSDQPAEEDDEPHTEPADEGDEEDADSGHGSPAKSGVSTGKGKGLTKSKSSRAPRKSPRHPRMETWTRPRPMHPKQGRRWSTVS